MTKKNGFFLGVLSIFGVATLVFQNCGRFQPYQSLTGVLARSQPIDRPLVAVLKWDNLFAPYPNSQKPEFMAELSVKAIRVVDATTSGLTIDGVIIKVDQPSTAVTYEARWLDANGNEICSARIGTTSATMRTFRYECLSTISVGPQTRLVGRIYAQTQTAGKVLVREIVRN